MTEAILSALSAFLERIYWIVQDVIIWVIVFFNNVLAFFVNSFFDLLMWVVELFPLTGPGFADLTSPGVLGAPASADALGFTFSFVANLIDLKAFALLAATMFAFELITLAIKLVRWLWGWIVG